jgi:two-component system, sensor histidine kinase PdtaS
MCARGELVNAGSLSRFGQYDGIYLVDRKRYVLYMSGIASNLFRTLGLLIDARGEDVSLLEAADRELVEQTFTQQQSLEVRHEMADGRVWTRKSLLLCLPRWPWLPLWISRAWPWAYRYAPAGEAAGRSDAVLVLIHNATEAVQKERELNVKAAMIQEVHHRVKNNLQNIAAILRIQARRAKAEETKQFLADAVNRVLSMSVIHEFLSQDSHRPINLRDVCGRIASQVVEVVNTPDKEVKFVVNGPNIRLPASQATPAALVINELILNAVEHGLADRRLGLIEILLHDLGDRVQLDITDDGSGLPPNFHPEQNSSLGLQIVRTLVTDDLKGAHPEINPGINPENSTESTPKHGTRATVIFPKRSLAVD